VIICEIDDSPADDRASQGSRTRRSVHHLRAKAACVRATAFSFDALGLNHEVIFIGPSGSIPKQTLGASPAILNVQLHNEDIVFFVNDLAQPCIPSLYIGFGV